MSEDRARTRAKDVDRQETVDLIDAAYSDGQLNAEERERRTAHALQARTLGALESLTRDLQPVPALVAAHRPRRRWGAIVAATVLLVGGVVTAIALNGDDPTPTASSEDVAPPALEEPAEPLDVADPPRLDPKPLRYSLTPHGLRNFIKIYEEEFGTTKAAAFGFTASSVIIAQHTPGGSRAWRYTRLGKFADHGSPYTYTDPETGEVKVRTFPQGQVNLVDLDVDAALRNLESVKQATGRSSFPTLGMSVLINEGTKGVSVAAGDSRAGSCLMQWTSMDGTVLDDPVPCE